MTRKQWQGWHEQAQQHYLVEPRHLAGGGDVRHVSEYLRACGWRDKTKAGGPLILHSPDRTVHVAYTLDQPPGGWTVHGKATSHHGEWQAVLGPLTPVEIVAGLTDALTHPASAHAPNAWAPLEEQGWKTRFEDQNYTATSPDNTAWVQYRRGPDGEAMWLCGATDSQGNGWTASLSATTPLHLVQAFTAELARPQPVMRPRGRIPRSTHLRTRSVSVTPSQLNAWQQSRVTAARAVTWARNSTTTARPRSPTARARTPF